MKWRAKTKLLNSSHFCSISCYVVKCSLLGSRDSTISLPKKNPRCALLFQACQVPSLSRQDRLTGIGRKGSPLALLFPSFSEGWSGIKALKSPELLRNQEVLQLPADSHRTQDHCFGTETMQDDLESPSQVQNSCKYASPHTCSDISNAITKMSLLHLVSMGKSYEWKLNQGRVG